MVKKNPSIKINGEKVIDSDIEEKKQKISTSATTSYKDIEEVDESESNEKTYEEEKRADD